jgi:hypothetical protein
MGVRLGTYVMPKPSHMGLGKAVIYYSIAYRLRNF